MQYAKADVAFRRARGTIGTNTMETKRFEAIRAAAKRLKDAEVALDRHGPGCEFCEAFSGRG
jgi:hypothetical protein